MENPGHLPEMRVGLVREEAVLNTKLGYEVHRKDLENDMSSSLIPSETIISAIGNWIEQFHLLIFYYFLVQETVEEMMTTSMIND